MFFVLKSVLLPWQYEGLYAKLLNYPPSGEERQWWHKWMSFEPLPEPPSPALEFSVPSGASLPDNLYALTVMHLFSARLVAILKQFDVRFESFPVRLMDATTGAELPSPYFASRLLEKLDAIDHEQSVLPEGMHLSIGRVLYDVDKLVLNSDCVQANRPMFDIRGKVNLRLINSELKAALETENITGFDFVPVPDYRMGKKWLLANYQPPSL